MEKFDKDFMRQGSSRGFRKGLSIIHRRMLLALYLLRKAEKRNGMMSRFFRSVGHHIYMKQGVEISDTTNIGGGLLLVHPYNIGINPRSVIGEDFTIFKGATIGSERTGKRAGVPTIGNRVTVCANAFVCGRCTIGDDVMICAGAFVNFDVPPNSIVIGNPAFVSPKEKASQDYGNM